MDFNFSEGNDPLQGPFVPYQRLMMIMS